MWMGCWRESAQQKATENLGRPNGGPLQVIGTEALLGAATMAQVQLNVVALDQSNDSPWCLSKGP